MVAPSRICNSCRTPLPPDAAFCSHCGAATPTEITDEFGADFEARLTSALAGRYAIERELGRGGMAIVLLADDEAGRALVTDFSIVKLWALTR